MSSDSARAARYQAARPRTRHGPPGETVRQPFGRRARGFPLACRSGCRV